MDDFQTKVIEGLATLHAKFDSQERKVDLFDTRLTLIERSTPHPDHENRIRQLEKAKWTLAGAAAVIGGVAGQLTNFFS